MEEILPYDGSDHITSLCGLPATDITDPILLPTLHRRDYIVWCMLTGPGEIRTNVYSLQIKQQ